MDSAARDSDLILADIATHELWEDAHHHTPDAASRCDAVMNGTRCGFDAGHACRHESDSPVGGFIWWGDLIPPPHGNTICVGCEACKIRAAKGLPLYA